MSNLVVLYLFQSQKKYLSHLTHFYPIPECDESVTEVFVEQLILIVLSRQIYWKCIGISTTTTNTTTITNTTTTTTTTAMKIVTNAAFRPYSVQYSVSVQYRVQYSVQCTVYTTVYTLFLVHYGHVGWFLASLWRTSLHWNFQNGPLQKFSFPYYSAFLCEQVQYVMWLWQGDILKIDYWLFRVFVHFQSIGPLGQCFL